MMTVLEQAKATRAAMDNAAIALPDADAVASKELYPWWDELIGETVEMGFRFRHGKALYKTKQKNYTFVDFYIPGATGTESLFEVIDETHSGTINDPIPYNGNMVLEEGKYYIQNDIVYLCTRSTGNAIYHPLADLVGLYVEVVA